MEIKWIPILGNLNCTMRKLFIRRIASLGSMDGASKSPVKTPKFYNYKIWPEGMKTES